MLIQEKIAQVKEILQEFDIDCWITFVRESKINGDPSLVYLVSSDVTWHSAFIITKTGETIAIVGKYDRATVEELGVYDRVIDFVEGLKAPFQKELMRLKPRQIALNYSEGSEICDGLTHGMYLTMVDLLSEIGLDKNIISSEKIVSALRERKTATEIAHVKEAITHTQDIFKAVSNFIAPGKTEGEIADFMKKEVEKKNIGFAWDASVCPSVFSGPETAGAHYAPTERIVKRGHVLNMDFGVLVNEYCSDLQRTFYILEEGENAAPPEVLQGFNTIVDAIEKSKQAMKPGILGREIDTIARDCVIDGGYEEFPHALGHQVGRFAHDGTALLGPKWEKYAQKPLKPLEAGMVFTIEPRLTIAGRGIATVEEMVLVTDEGCEYLSNPQKEIILIG